MDLDLVHDMAWHVACSMQHAVFALGSRETLAAETLRIVIAKQAHSSGVRPSDTAQFYTASSACSALGTWDIVHVILAAATVVRVCAAWNRAFTNLGFPNGNTAKLVATCRGAAAAVKRA